MTGDEVRAVFEQMLPQEALNRLCPQCGVIERQRKLHLVLLVRALVIAAGTPGGAYQADVWRADLESEVPRVTRAACSRWFDEPLERLMAARAQRALAYARAQQVDLPGPLSGVKDWDRVDSTTIKVRDALLEEFPGTGDDAVLKVHKILSVGGGAPVRYHVSPARDHDRPHVQIDDSWRGYGLRADRASARRARLRACETDDVRFVIRLQDNWKPTVDYSARGPVPRAFLPGTDLDALLEEETLVLDGHAIDADVPVGEGTHPLPLRLGGVQTPQGYCVFLTPWPPRIGPRQVADLYRVRWEGALRIKLDQSVPRLDQIDAERPCSLKTRLHASRIAATIAAVLAHQHHLATRPQAAGAPRTAAPLHTRLLALQRAVSCQCIAQAFELKGTAAIRRWDKIAERLTHAGTDPTWRRRPSVVDQVRGWTRQPLAREKNRHHRLQMVA